MRFWIFWSDVDTTPTPPNYVDQWARYVNHPQFLELDQAIADANARGIYVLLGLGSSSPPWASAATAREPSTGKAITARFASAQPGSPWEKFAIYCYNRYRYINAPNYSGIYNGTGPSGVNGYGNPRSAWCALFNIVNEPNYEYWQDFDSGCAAAQMMMTMDNAVAAWGQGAGLLGPDLSDCSTVYVNSVKRSSDYAETAGSVLDSLTNWQPRCSWSWSHHCYTDVKNGNNQRAETVRSLLYSKNWRGGGDRVICLTEGGWSLGPGGWGGTAIQEQKVRDHWYLARSADYHMATQHLVVNGALPTTGMTDVNKAPSPLWTTFANLQPRR